MNYLKRHGARSEFERESGAGRLRLQSEIDLLSGISFPLVDPIRNGAVVSQIKYRAGLIDSRSH